MSQQEIAAAAAQAPLVSILQPQPWYADRAWMQAERARIARTPPDILITTPESLYLLLTSRARELFASLETVIVDEIHAVAGDKRGAHLALSLERLDALVTEAGGAPPQRIGLSATVRPVETAARLLVGAARPLPTIVNVGQRRDLDLAIDITLTLYAGYVSADDKGREAVAAGREQPIELPLHFIEHRVLEQQIVNRIG